VRDNLGALFRNLRTGLRAALFLRIDSSRLSASPGQFAALVVLGLALQLVSGMVREGWEGDFSLQALPRALVYVPLLLLAAWVIARRAGHGLLLALAVLFCATSLVYDVAFEALWLAADAGWAGAHQETAWNVVYAAWAAACLLGAARLAGPGAGKRLAAMIVLAAIVLVPLWHLPWEPLWVAQEESGEDGPDAFAVSREEVFYAQPALLERAMGRLAPSRPGVADIYFVGAATFSAEDVFMKELRVVAQLFRERFDASQRTLLLMNNPSTAGSEPVATSTSIARSLRRVGELMDREEDVLFLYLTTHGSEDHKLAMRFWPLQLNDIDPAMLRTMLDEARIKWRVIVISACYSGGFIEALKDAHTLVMTAAEATRQSFGCGTESDFTYFGRAYFDEALRATSSFTAAFENARARIAQRERAEALTPSNPQMFVGARMPAKLEEVYRSLRASQH